MTALIVSIVAAVLASIALVVGCIGLSIIVGLKNSTHTVQYQPLDEVLNESSQKTDVKPNLNMYSENNPSIRQFFDVFPEEASDVEKEEAETEAI